MPKKQLRSGEGREAVNREEKSKDREARGKAYSAAASEEPEKAATIAGEMTNITNTAPMKRSCMEVILLEGRPYLACPHDEDALSNAITK
jgi:hypothetical protein